MRLLFILNSEDSFIRNFFKVTILIFVGIILLFETALYRLGETLPYALVHDRQRLNGEIFLPEYFNVGAEYKKEGMSRKKPNILALGTSRIVQLSEDLFAEHVTFYNAGLDASTSREIDGMIRLLQSLSKEELPKIIVLGVDPWVLNPHYPANQRTAKRKILDVVEAHPALNYFYGGYRFLSGRWQAYEGLIRERHNWLSFLWAKGTEGIGLNAKLTHAGFLVDGSFVYPQDIKIEPARTSTDWVRWLHEDRYRFAPADELDESVLEKLKGLLGFCQEQDIKVVGVLMPFRNDFYDALINSSRHAKFFEKFRRVTCDTLKSFEDECFDLSSPYALNLHEDDFIDTNHLKREAFIRIVQRFLPVTQSPH